MFTRRSPRDFTDAAVELTRNLKMGNGLEPGVQVGPMFEASALEKTAGPRRRRPGQGGEDLDRRRQIEPL